MTRLEKKCFLFSVGLHALLLVVLVGTSAFRERPEPQDMPILTLIPSTILDKAGAGGGSPNPVAPQPQPQPQPPKAQPPQPAPPIPAPRMPVTHAAERMEHPQPREVKPVFDQPVEKEVASDEGLVPKRTHKQHVITPSFTKASFAETRTERTKATETSASSESSAKAAARRRSEIAAAFNDLARHVQTSGAAGTVVDMPGQGGGAAFVGYETYIYNAYYHAWVTPDSVANKLAAADVKIVVARDGSILSAEVINPSGEHALDRSVERALREVQHLPPFPETARDEQRSFLIRFNLEAKDG